VLQIVLLLYFDMKSAFFLHHTVSPSDTQLYKLCDNIFVNTQYFEIGQFMIYIIDSNFKLDIDTHLSGLNCLEFLRFIKNIYKKTFCVHDKLTMLTYVIVNDPTYICLYQTTNAFDITTIYPNDQCIHSESLHKSVVIYPSGIIDFIYL
jgi:hypothetical protein